MQVSRQDSSFKRKAELWKSPKTFATSLLILFLDQFDTEGLGWSPITIIMEIQEFYSIDLPQINIDKLMAAILLTTTDNFYWSLPDFIMICNVLSGSPVHPDLFDPAEPHEMAWGLSESLLIHMPEDGKNLKDLFSDEIIGYIGQACRDIGLITMPDILQLGAGEDLTNKVKYDYSDDPEMFKTIWETEKEKTDDINDMVKTRLKELLQEVASLPLTNGKTEVVGKMMAQIQ